MLEELTFDQIFIMAADKKLLENQDLRTVSIEELRGMGLLKKVKDGEPRTLAQRIIAGKKESEAKARRAKKREQKQQHAKAIIEARARGEL